MNCIGIHMCSSESRFSCLKQDLRRLCPRLNKNLHWNEVAKIELKEAFNEKFSNQRQKWKITILKDC